MIRPMSKIVHVVSHGPTCLDGVTAAAAVARYYGDHARSARDLRASNSEIDAVLRRCAPRATASTSCGSLTSPGAIRPPTST